MKRRDQYRKAHIYNNNNRFSRRHINQVKTIKISCILVLSAIFLFILIMGPVFLTTQATDAETIEDLSYQSANFDLFNGYATMALLYRITNELQRNIIVVALSIATIVYFLKDLSSIKYVIATSFLLIAPITMYFPYFVKDTMTIPMELLSVFVLSKRKINIWYKILIIFSAYILYALPFRSYYIIISCLWLLLVLLKNSSYSMRYIIIILCIVVFLLIPDHLYYQIQERRDEINALRVAWGGAGNRTAFLNFVTPSGADTFIVNYVYALVRLNLPFFDVDAKSLFLFANVLLFLPLAIFGAKQRHDGVYLSSLLFATHFLVLVIFEPDLGSYLRHISTAFILLRPAIMALDQRARTRKAAPARNRKFHRSTTLASR